jgi:hypothetical protein
MEVWIIRTVYSKFDYKYCELRQNIINHLIFNNYSGKGILTRKTYPIHLLEQVGTNGSIKKEIKLKDENTYEYHIDEIIPIDNKNNRLCFVNIDKSQEYCACLLYNTKKSGKSVLRIEGIFNGEDCIKCTKGAFGTDKNNKYKVGNILMQVILEIVKTKKEFEHITEIELSDTSIKKCYGIGIKLKYLRTITHGEPYYAKYGFRPQNKLDYKTYKYNKDLYKKSVHINSSIIKDIFKLGKELKKNVYKTYKKYIEGSLSKVNDIDPAILLKNLIELENMKKPFELSNEEKSNICELVSFTVKNIYLACGYKDYALDLWTLQLK